MALLILLLIQLNATVGLANDNLSLSVNSMPLSSFASAIADGMSISIAVDESIADFTVDGQFNGSIETLLNELYERYGINHTVYENGYQLWRDSNFYSAAIYQFQLSDMEIVTFLNYLSQATGFRLIADTSMNINVNGAFSGTLRDIINALSNQYPVLFHIGEDTISVASESSFVKRAILISNSNYSSEALLTNLRAKLSPGNFVNRQNNQLIVGGHPEFVKTTSLQIQVDMAAASIASELVSAQFPLVSDAVSNTRLDKMDSKLSEISGGRVPLLAGTISDTILMKQNTELAESLELVDEEVEFSDPDDEAARFTNQDEATELTELDDDVVTSLEPDIGVAESKQAGEQVAVLEQSGAEVAMSDTSDAASAVTRTSRSEVEAKVVSDDDVQIRRSATVDSVDQIPGFY